MSSLYSVVLRSFGSKYTLRRREPSKRYRWRLRQSRGVNQVFQAPCERGEILNLGRERAMLLDGTGMMRRFAMITTSLPLNFFSSSRTKRC